MENFKLYFQQLSDAEKNKIDNEVSRIARELWAKGFTLGMIGCVGEGIKEKMDFEIAGKKKKN